MFTETIKDGSMGMLKENIEGFDEDSIVAHLTLYERSRGW